MELKDISYHCFSISFLIVSLWPEEMQVTYVSTELISADWHPTPVLLSGKIPWMEEPGRLQYIDWVAKSRTRLSDFTFNFHFHALGKEMATHSSVLAWRIPGTGEPVGLPSMGSHRVRHD